MGGYTPGQDPGEMFRDIKVFALEYKYYISRSAKTNSLEALQLAYGTAELRRHPSRDREVLVVTKDFPQIYFLTSGQPDGGARQILDEIDKLDSGRNIPVNSVSWTMPGDA